MQLWQIYKELYEHEVMIRNYYDGKLGQTFTILSATAGLIIFSLENERSVSVCSNFIIGLLVSSIVVFLCQIFFLFRAYFSFKYRYMDFPVDMLEDDIKEQMVRDGISANFEETIESYISSMLYRTYKKCTETYYKTNINKRKYHHVLNIFTFINFILLIFQYMILFLGGK